MTLNQTPGEMAYHRLRADITFARLPPGRRLRLDQLKGEYAVSIATLREVLSRLAAEGLLQFENAKGFEVAPVSATDLAEIAEMRLLLESHAIGASFAAGDLDWEAQVVATHHKLSRMEQRMMAGDRSVAVEWKRYDRAFHTALIAACGSEEMLAAYDRIFDRFLRYQMLMVMFRGATAAAEHDALLAAALERDPARARTVLAAHIGACVTWVTTHSLTKGGAA